MYSLYM